MSSESLRIYPAALEEAEAAVNWHAQRSKRAAEMFLDELYLAVDQIGENPERYPLHELGTRRIVLRRFPFMIVFRKAVTSMRTGHCAAASGTRRRH